MVWDNTTFLSTDPVSTAADATGFFQTSTTIPSKATAGTHVLRVQSSEAVFVDTSVTVNVGSITFSKANGPPLSKIQVTGSAFDANANVTVYFDGTALDAASTKTDSIGGFVSTVTVPLTAPGAHTIKAETSQFNSAVSDFTVDSPTLTIQPSSAKPGDEITVYGSSFAVGGKVKIFVDKTEVKTKPEELTTDGSGNFTTIIYIPRLSFSSVVHISARTGDSDVAIIGYPLNQPALVLAARTYTKIGEVIGLGFLLVLLAVKAYQKLFFGWLGRNRHISEQQQLVGADSEQNPQLYSVREILVAIATLFKRSIVGILKKLKYIS
ncbi:hypothetical protein HY086_03200 [Candidatus Gottesmanbacteria bacterium]|nr:hypothetical protein [Candidatus Gottesmanbacteria bacterium]